MLAQALLRRGDVAHELLRFINPIHRSYDRGGVSRYRVEPYTVAADIYSAQAHTGRGGWTWYTGAAGWMYRVTIESLLGIQREGPWLRLEPCVPAGWPAYKVTLRIDGAEYAIEVDNRGRAGSGVVSVAMDGKAVPDGRIPLEPGSGQHAVHVVLGRAIG